MKYYVPYLEFIFSGKISKPRPENFYIPLALLTWSHNSCTHQDSTGLASAGGVSSLQSVAFPCSFYLVFLPFSLSPFHLAQWPATISTTLIQSEPARQSRQDTTPTAVLSPLITYILSLLAFSPQLSLFSLYFCLISHCVFSLHPPPPSVHLFVCISLLSIRLSLSLSPLFSSSACRSCSLSLSFPTGEKQPKHKVMGSISIPG